MAGINQYFAVTAPGLAELTAIELQSLFNEKAVLQRLSFTAASFTTKGGRAEAGPASPADIGSENEIGGVAFQGSLEDLYRANLHLRTASRVLVRLGDFYAAGFPELRKKASRLEWERFIRPGQPLMLHVTCHKSRLYHSGAVMERILAAIADRLGKPSPVVKASPSENEDYPVSPNAQLIVVRISHDHCMVSIDSSGELLHRRGYRLASAKAPLRETLAAAMLLTSGWDAVSPLIDPFCGSGTIAIEAAMLALRIPPGRSRKFAFMNWPGYHPDQWQALLSAHPALPLAGCSKIQASDRDMGAIQMALANATRAGVADCIEFKCQAVSAIQPPEIPGWVVTNPPYGIRVSASKDLRNLYAQVGNVLRACCPGWHVAILCNDIKLLGQVGLRLDVSFSMVNGGVKVRLGRGTVI